MNTKKEIKGLINDMVAIVERAYRIGKRDRGETKFKPKEKNGDNLLTIYEAARHCQVHVGSFRNRITLKNIPENIIVSKKLGKTRRIFLKRYELKEWAQKARGVKWLDMVYDGE